MFDYRIIVILYVFTKNVLWRIYKLKRIIRISLSINNYIISLHTIIIIIINNYWTKQIFWNAIIMVDF